MQQPSEPSDIEKQSASASRWHKVIAILKQFCPSLTLPQRIISPTYCRFVSYLLENCFSNHKDCSVLIQGSYSQSAHTEHYSHLILFVLNTVMIYPCHLEEDCLLGLAPLRDSSLSVFHCFSFVATSIVKSAMQIKLSWAEYSATSAYPNH